MFSPYHQFPNNKRLEDIIKSLKLQGNVSQDVFKAFNRYHFSLVYKLKCAKNQVDNLNSFLSTPPLEEIVSDCSIFIFQVNMYLDCFFYFGGSVLDILAREVLSYFNETLPTKVYYSTARNIISSRRPGDPILSKLNDPSWKSDFSMYRNTGTHELIIAEQFSINLNRRGETQENKLILPLPDDPRVDPNERTFRKYTDVEMVN